MQQDRTRQSGGLPFALGAYAIWGLLPFFYFFLLDVAPLELVGWRVIFTLPVCILLLVVFRQVDRLRAALRNPRAIGVLAISATIIGVNWLIFVFALQNGHVLATSLGFYINPMVNVLLGTVFLKERLGKTQWIAVGIALAGVGLLAFGAVGTLWISLSLAFSFSAYGLIRKLAPVDSLPGLTIETMLWLLPAIGIVWWFAGGETGSAIVRNRETAFLLATSGALTAIPLTLFATAARLMDYSTLGFVQYLAPTLSFIIGIVVFGERLVPVQLVTFALIWIAIAVFSWGILAERRKAGRSVLQPPA
ncbi:MAG: EamA family transporter RarD [Sphingomonadaceae bacterium]